jgi:hypothetical protein
MKKVIYRLIDFLFAPLTVLSALLLIFFRKKEIKNPPLSKNFPVTKKILRNLGIFPVIDHYYDPLFRSNQLRYSLRLPRSLPGIDFNDKEQLELLDSFHYNDELIKFPLEKTCDKVEYCYNHGAFLYGDSEYLYNMIRHFKPCKIIEIGSGYSTLMAINAIEKNKSETKNYTCDHICIEPYECPWLEEKGIKVIRQKAETMDPAIFKTLNENDFLFIDSSHIIRPQGDVLFEYLEVLPVLNNGVICHIHDIFTPADYLDEWVGEKLWNEQYLLEAFLSHNREFRILGALNYLSHKYAEKFESKCPIYAKQKGREPASFWIQKRPSNI